MLGPSGSHQRAPDHAERRIMGQIVRLRDVARLSWDKISDLMESQVCQVEGRQFKKSAFAKRKWNRFRCRRAYHICKRILAVEAKEAEAARAGANSPHSLGKK